MIGNAKHEVSVESKVWDNVRKDWVERQPVVFLVNNDDSHYWQGFETRAELDAFIEQLRAAGEQAFAERPP